MPLHPRRAAPSRQPSGAPTFQGQPGTAVHSRTGGRQPRRRHAALTPPSLRPEVPPMRPLARSSTAALLVASLAAACRPADGARAGSSAPGAVAGSIRSGPSAATVTGEATGAVATRDSVSVLADRARIQGAENAPVWLGIISDFQCPYCASWHEESYPALVREYVQTGKVRMAYVNLPLNIHPNARPAAEAAMCAGVQGRFWQMHDALFTTQQRWAAMSDPTPLFDSLAVSVGVDQDAMRRCVQTHATRAIVDADDERSQAAGVRSTPSFFIGRTLIEGAQPVGVFRHALDSALAA